MNANIVSPLQVRMVANIKRRLQQHNMTQRDLAKQAGMHYSTLSRIMHGKHQPTLGSCWKISMVLNIEPESIFERQLTGEHEDE